MGDVNKPLKSMLQDYTELEARVAEYIYLLYNMPAHPSSSTHRADLIALATERRDLMGELPEWSKFWAIVGHYFVGQPLPPKRHHPYMHWSIIDGIAPLPERIVPWTARKSYKMFLNRFFDLKETIMGFR